MTEEVNDKIVPSFATKGVGAHMARGGGGGERHTPHFSSCENKGERERERDNDDAMAWCRDVAHDVAHPVAIPASIATGERKPHRPLQGEKNARKNRECVQFSRLYSNKNLASAPAGYMSLTSLVVPSALREPTVPNELRRGTDVLDARKTARSGVRDGGDDDPAAGAHSDGT